MLGIKVSISRAGHAHLHACGKTRRKLTRAPRVKIGRHHHTLCIFFLLNSRKRLGSPTCFPRRAKTARSCLSHSSLNQIDVHARSAIVPGREGTRGCCQRRRPAPSAGIAELMEHVLVERECRETRSCGFRTTEESTLEEAQALARIVKRKKMAQRYGGGRPIFTRGARVYIFLRWFFHKA